MELQRLQPPGPPLLFVANCWIGGPHGQCSEQKLSPAREEAWEVVVVTDGQLGAGSDARVSIEMVGSLGG